MKILFFTRSYYPNIGGVEKHIFKLSEELLDRGHDITIITERPFKSYSNKYQLKTVSARMAGRKNPRVIEINAGADDWFKKFRIWKELFGYIGLIAKSDTIHSHDVFFWYLPFRFIFPLKKNYVTFHGYEGNNIPHLKAVIMHKMAEILTNGNICVGQFLEKWYKTKSTFITYGAVDKKIIDFKAEPVKFSNKVMFIGRLEYETGILEYLKAVKLLEDKKIKLQLDVYGDGTLFKKAKEYSLRNNLNVNFKGFVRNTENLALEYNFAFVSRYLSILESMASKKPVFAHYNNSIKKDYLEMTPFADYIHISDSYLGIAEQIKESINSKNVFVEQAYKWVRKETWQKIADMYLQLWGLKRDL